MEAEVAGMDLCRICGEPLADGQHSLPGREAQRVPTPACPVDGCGCLVMARCQLGLGDYVYECGAGHRWQGSIMGMTRRLK